MEGTERAQEASGGGSGGEAGHLQGSGDAGGGGTVVWIAGVDEGPVTAVEPSQRPCVGGVYYRRGGGHRVCACLTTLFRMIIAPLNLDGVVISVWGRTLVGARRDTRHTHLRASLSF